mmetsp:Transcript_19575/g.28967  ORF Transcript_19575/g.28967 Transcript_19575/m.28967 type:complete len:144 (-) Transcript_19575:123-554(-)|eukprot:CAMPEP_0194028034 /NCGR_PEP_ID=MMETSP0009_2-20130614/2064_1 /TAXON_ID=210454 /ORGANISM="Grammatophora oceanica, Strain CCMP 410" /LENGTH=143 /DNA_ID=CAMNT_0038667279 /DNA_START=83 /DNA_END=514 /DNA_ORIENTATION=-
MLSARRTVLRTGGRVATLYQRRSAQTVPRLGTEKEMEAEALEQIRARIAYQKKVIAESGAHSHAEEVAEMVRWIKISLLVAIPLCVVSALKDLLFLEHDHAKEGPYPDYMAIRHKEFPWECEECPLFDQKCWNKCRAEKAAES